jgi:hypothetical protein
MRLPRIKVWRAFSEFDGMSDEQCWHALNQMAFTVGKWPIALKWLGGAVGIGIFAAANVFGGLDEFPRRWLPNDPGASDVMEAAWGILGGLVFGIVGVLLARDWVYYLLLRAAMKRRCCRKCGQSLMGVRIIDTSLYGEPGKAKVRCPECGTLFVLLDIGLSPRDLIPFEGSRSLSDVGRLRGTRTN